MKAMDKKLKDYTERKKENTRRKGDLEKKISCTYRGATRTHLILIIQKPTPFCNPYHVSEISKSKYDDTAPRIKGTMSMSHSGRFENKNRKRMHSEEKI